MRIHILVNPVAGSGKALKIFPPIEKLLGNYDISHSFTDRSGEDFREFIKNNRDIDYVICLGGDGTLNKAVSAIAHSNTVIIPLPAGTGSDFSRSIGYAKPEELPHLIEKRKYVECDLGLIKFDGRKNYFINIMEAGFGATVMQRVNSIKNRRKKSFVSSILLKIVDLKSYNITVKSYEYNKNLDVSEMIIANGRYFGGGMLASKDSILNDNMLDIHIIHKISRLKLVRKLNTLKNGTYINDSNVDNFKTDSLMIKGEIPYEIDGENFTASDLEITIDHKAIKIIDFDNKPSTFI